MASLNTALSPSPVVTVINKDGTTATGYTGNVTMTLGTNPTNATLGGTDVVAAVSGVATFSNLTLDRSGKNFTLLATAAAQGGYTPKPRISRPFTIATRCVFTTQPTSVTAPNDILPTFTVTIQDGDGNTDTSYNGEITVALYTGASLGILGGFTTRLASAGVVNFSGLSVDAQGIYSVRATAETVLTAYSPAPSVSDLFAVAVDPPVFTEVYNNLVTAPPPIGVRNYAYRVQYAYTGLDQTGVYSGTFTSADGSTVTWPSSYPNTISPTNGNRYDLYGWNTGATIDFANFTEAPESILYGAALKTYPP